MAIGLGKQYWVHVIKVHFGDLESCIEFMKNNEPKTNLKWFELRPLVSVKKGKAVTCNEYNCSLVEDAHGGK